MNIDTELQDYEAAGSLAEELPYWGRPMMSHAGRGVDEPWPAFRLASLTARPRSSGTG